ncbi:MAG: 2-hydroxyacyl-CoA dehydratase family protein [Bacillota bacterium]
MSAPLPLVYYTCSYVPPEAIWAAGCQPVRLLPSHPAPGECDAFLPRDFCAYVRAAFWDLYRRTPQAAAAVVLTTCCDPMRRLADVLRHHLPHLPAFLVDLPRERGNPGEERLAGELDKLYLGLRALPGACPPSGGLAGASRLFAEMRSLLSRTSQFMSGPAFHRLVRQVFTSDPRDALDFLRSLAAPVPAGGVTTERPVVHTGPRPAVMRGGAAAPGRSGEPGVMVITSHPVDPGVLEVMEQAGARVVAEDSCLGERILAIPPGGGDWGQLARAYLERPPCPRMELPEERLAYLEELARRRGAQGIVFLALKFCDNLGYDFPWISRGSSLPVLFLEAEYRASASGQLLTRVQAFAETLPARAGGRLPG